MADTLRVAHQKITEIGTGDQGDIRAAALDHQQIAVMGIGQGRVVGIGQVPGVGIEIGKGVVVTTVQRQALALEIGEVVLVTSRLAMGDEDLGIFQAHVDTHMGDLLPAPFGILEDRHVGAALLKVAEAPRDGRGYQDKAVTLLVVVERLDQLRQQAGIGPLLRAHGIGREMRRPDLDLDFFGRPDRRKQPHCGKH
ncbi:hypothetical protein D3C79_700660 [compost metagenome]